MAHKTPELPYAYDALEPYIDTQTMQIHRDKHHTTYVGKLNDALDKHPSLHEKEVEDLIADLSSVPEDIRTAVRNNGGGHANHSLFWQLMSPQSRSAPMGELSDAINAKFGTFESFQEAFTQQALGRFGSGWAWLIVRDGQLELTSTPNQDNPLMKGVADTPGTPILGIDVWEHAYYLKYQNRRADYVHAWWNIVNWDKVEELYAKAKR